VKSKLKRGEGETKKGSAHPENHSYNVDSLFKLEDIILVLEIFRPAIIPINIKTTPSQRDLPTCSLVCLV